MEEIKVSESVVNVVNNCDWSQLPLKDEGCQIMLKHVPPTESYVFIWRTLKVICFNLNEG